VAIIFAALVALVLYLLKRHAYAPAAQTAEYPGRPLFTSEYVERCQAQTAAHPVALWREYESISFTIELPNKLLIRDFAQAIQDVTTALEKAGYILYLINSGEIPERLFIGETPGAHPYRSPEKIIPPHDILSLNSMCGVVRARTSPSPPRRSWP
jgi:hypothetical protein